jgi:hypothetical protein
MRRFRMGWIFVLISGIAVFLFWKVQNSFLMISSILILIGIFWSYGIMHNYATEAAKKRYSYTGGFYDFKDEEIDAVPNWLANINMGMSFVGIILFVISLIITLR